jgi:Cu+-exporting ATPase
MIGSARGAEAGILFKDAAVFERAGRIDTVVLDKTGTLTRGEPSVTDVCPVDGVSDNELLRLAASAEQGSEHPIARAIVEEAGRRGLELSSASDFSARAGFGIAARVEGEQVLVGTARLLEEHDLDPDRFGEVPGSLRAQGKTVVLATRGGQPLGVLAVADTLKPEARETVAALKALGLEVVMLTGDNPQTAEAIAREIGIEHYVAEVLPDEKARHVAELQSGGRVAGPERSVALAGGTTERNGATRRLGPATLHGPGARRGRVVAMVGDGINDAPALAVADLGIAIGSGTDVAKETGDVVLVGGRLDGIPQAIRLSRATLRTIRQNLFWAFAYNTALVPLAAGVLDPLAGRVMIQPILAAAAMALSSVSVVGNSLRLRRKGV